MNISMLGVAGGALISLALLGGVGVAAVGSGPWHGDDGADVAMHEELSEADHEAMHEACEKGDYEGMLEAMRSVLDEEAYEEMREHMEDGHDERYEDGGSFRPHDDEHDHGGHMMGGMMH